MFALKGEKDPPGGNAGCGRNINIPGSFSCQPAENAVFPQKTGLFDTFIAMLSISQSNFMVHPAITSLALEWQRPEISHNC
jgi:hypothetical protein